MKATKFFLLLTIALLLGISCKTIPEVTVTEEDTPLTLSEQAHDYFYNKEYRAAIAYYQAIIDNFSEEEYERAVAWAYYEIGYCYYSMKEYDTAIDYFSIVTDTSRFSEQAPRILAEKMLRKIEEEMEQEEKLIDTDSLDEESEIEILDSGTNE